jgi:hypothetical protein
MFRLLAMALMIAAAGSTAPGAFEGPPRGARIMGLGGASSGLTGEIWSIPANPASAGTIRERSFAVSITPNPFGIPELTRADAAFLEPFAPGSLAVTASVFGSDLYRESEFSCAAGGALFKRFVVGVSLTWYVLSIRDYGSAWTVGVTAGVLIPFTDRLCIGLGIRNVNAPVIGAVREPLPQAMHLGFGYHPLPALLIAADIEKDVRFPPHLAVGFEFMPVEALHLRGGTTLEPATYSAGLGLRTAVLRLDYAFSTHPELGRSHTFSVALALEGW